MRNAVLALVSLLVLTGCAGPGESQHGLRGETLVIDTAKGPVRFRVEIADTMEARNQGLMYRKELAPDAGMLFVYERPQVTVFWMHNTYIPLDMIFVRGNGTISSIAPNVKILSDNRTSAREPVLGVIEINAGRAAALGINPGDKVHARAFGNAVP